MKKTSKEEIRGFNSEQIAGVALTIMQEIDRNERKAGYDSSSLESILSFEIVPIWLGKKVVNGCLRHNDTVCIYGGDKAPDELQILYDNAIELLRREDLIKADSSQLSANFIILTEKGRKMKISVLFELDIIRRPEDITNRYKKSVFLMETMKEGKKSCGTCFLIEKFIMVTCKHNVEGRNFKIYFNDDIHCDNCMFNVTYHPVRDIALVGFKSNKQKSIVANLRPFAIDEEHDSLKLGEQLITIGYPLVPFRKPQLLVDVGTFQNYTRDYSGKVDYITFSNKISGGCSGGPVITLKEKIVAVIDELTEQLSDSTKKRSLSIGENIYGHGVPAKYIYDIL